MVKYRKTRYSIQKLGTPNKTNASLETNKQRATGKIHASIHKHLCICWHNSGQLQFQYVIFPPELMTTLKLLKEQTIYNSHLCIHTFIDVKINISVTCHNIPNFLWPHNSDFSFTCSIHLHVVLHCAVSVARKEQNDTSDKRLLIKEQE